MFANAFQSGFISLFYSVGSNPLHLWDKSVKNGHIRRVLDDEVRSLVLDISGTNVATTYITCPIKPRASLGIKLPFLVMIIKNMKKYFTFEIQILDDKDMHRRFRVSNFQSTTKVRPFCTTMPIGLSAGWNQIQFNLADFTRRAYGSTYVETNRIQIHANVRVRRIYFCDRLYSDEEMPNDFKLFVPPVSTKQGKVESRKGSKQVDAATMAAAAAAAAAGKGAAVEEIPSGALPSPAGPASEAGTERMETVISVKDMEVEPQEEAEQKPEEAVAEAPAEEGAGEPSIAPEEAAAEPPAEGEEAAPAEGEVAAPAEGEETAPAEGEVAVPAEGEEATPAEGETAVPAEEKAPEATVEGEEPPAAAEEAPVEAPPEGAQEAPSEAPAEEVVPLEAPLEEIAEEGPQEVSPEEPPSE